MDKGETVTPDDVEDIACSCLYRVKVEDVTRSLLIQVGFYLPNDNFDHRQKFQVAYDEGFIRLKETDHKKM